ncbi:hypothetical protein [Streptomyces sp. NPDC058683]|uniref:hypothetical protein n=1 Tax=Streptomyces sp. NPDC058683 TaxID=3346597 RepID=UPI0036565BCE
MLMDKPRRGFWCPCWTEDLTDEMQWPALRATFDACSAPQADRRVAIALRAISPALDPDASDITWTIRPVVFLPPARRQDIQLPPCAYVFKPQAGSSTSGAPD